MTIDQLKAQFEEAQAIIKRERRMRANVLQGHPEQAKRLAEMDRLLEIIVSWKDLIKPLCEPTFEQPPLLDVPRKVEYR